MRPQPSTLIAASAAVLSLMLVAGCEAKVHGDPLARHHPGPQLLAPAPMVRTEPLPDVSPNLSAAASTGLDARIMAATAEATDDGATISMAVHDRLTEQTTSNGNATALVMASVAKLFIADDLLLQDATGQSQLSADDRKALDVMLRSSDDTAAENFWNRGGGNAIITRVAARYGLASLAPPYDGRWCNTMITAADLVQYYDMLLDGTGGLPQDEASVIINNLSQSTPQGIDGYPQRFGIPDGLFAEPVAVKQGWMCCWNGGNWMHLSTGVVGPDRRYVMVIGSLQPTDDAAARDTITAAVKSVFPGGRID
jgi:hypothetical protein